MTAIAEVYEVTSSFTSYHTLIPEYPFYRGDILVRQNDGTFTKTAPGLCLTGFRITADEEFGCLRRLSCHPHITFM